MTENRIGIITDDDFGLKNVPPYPKPSFISFEHPLRIKLVVDHLERNKIFDDSRIIKLKPKKIDKNVISLGHSEYHIDSIKRISNLGGGLLSDEVYITKDTYLLAKKAVGGCIRAIEDIISAELSQSFALIRPPGHHALREHASGLCIFNNIANAVLYLRNYLGYNKKIMIIDIDDHFGDGLAKFFYKDPSVLYFSIHEYDFMEADLGFIDEIGYGEGIGKSVNFPVPAGITNKDFYECFDLMELLAIEFKPDLIIIASGFDMYFDDPIGNCFLTSEAYYKFTKKILEVSENICNNKIAFILEGGYSLIGLPYCVHAVLKALLKERYEPPEFERENIFEESKIEEIIKIKNALKKILTNYWKSIDIEVKKEKEF